MVKIIFLVLVIFNSTLFASIGKIISYDGDVIVARKNKHFDARVGFKILKKDTIKTKKHSKVKIFFRDATIITIGQNSKLNIAEYLYSENSPKLSKTNFKFLKGAFSLITGKIGKIAKKRFKLQTKTATIGIRGTIIIGNQKEIACTQGAIDVTSENKTVIVPAGMITQIEEGYAPTPPVEYSNNQLDEIDAGLNNNMDYQNIQEEKNLEIDKLESNAVIENVVITSDVKNISNIASGVKNIAEQNIHSIEAENGVIKNVNIKGKAVKINNVSSGTLNKATQNIGNIKTK